MRSEFFALEELLPPEVLGVLCEGAAWRLVTPFVGSLDGLRRLYGGPLSVNGNGRRYCGLRPRDCAEGAPRSSHKGIADDIQGFDLHATDLDRLVSVVKANSQTLRIVRMEDPASTRSWVHIEVSAQPVSAPLVVFRP